MRTVWHPVESEDPGEREKRRRGGFGLGFGGVCYSFLFSVFAIFFISFFFFFFPEHLFSLFFIRIFLVSEHPANSTVDPQHSVGFRVEEQARAVPPVLRRPSGTIRHGSRGSRGGTTSPGRVLRGWQCAALSLWRRWLRWCEWGQGEWSLLCLGIVTR